MATVASRGSLVHGGPPPRWLMSWMLFGVFLTVWLGGLYLAFDYVQVSTSEGLAALEASTFTTDLPAGVQLTTGTADYGAHTIAFADGRETPSASGAAVAVRFAFQGSELTAEAEFARIQSEHREVLREQPARARDMPPLELRSFPTDAGCFTTPSGAVCQFVAGSAWVEVVSNLPAFVPGEDHHIAELSRAAYDHAVRVLHL